MKCQSVYSAALLVVVAGCSRQPPISQSQEADPGELAALQGRFDALHVEHQQVIAERNAAESKSEQLGRVVARLEPRVDMLENSDLNAAIDEIEALKDRLAAADSQLLAKDDELTEAEERNAFLKRGHDSLQQKYDNLRGVSSQSSGTGLEVLGIDLETTEKNQVWHRMAYQFTVRNNTSSAVKVDADVNFLNSRGFIVDSNSEYDIAISPRGSKVVRGFALVRPPGADEVRQISVTLIE